jgi:hypothetical protein
MNPLFSKLNLKAQTEILVLNVPERFESEIDLLKDVSVIQDDHDVKEITFLLAFVTQQDEINEIAAIALQKAQNDAVIWFAYPKASSKKYKCDFNHDTGWQVLGKSGFESVRQVALDADWSALRFRRVIAPRLV